MRLLPVILLVGINTFISCNQDKPVEEVQKIGLTNCQVQPGYIAKQGFNPSLSALSSSEKKIKGLVLVQFANESGAVGKTWQHPSWSRFGWMGSISSDDKGNSFVAPAPVVSVLDNPTTDQNTIYRVDGQTAEMSVYYRLPIPDSTTGNPYGLLGLYFDCHSKLLYASSVAGSSSSVEKGIIYAIDPEKAKVVDELRGFDAIGLCVGGITGEKKLYLGHARDGGIYAVSLTPSGKFTGEPKLQFSLDMLGPRGDDKARRLRFNQQSELQVWGIEFNYNLTAASEKQESTYRFRYDAVSAKWENIVQVK